MRALALIMAVAAAACAGCGGASGSEDAAGADRPVGPVTMVVPFAAGGGSDIAGRAVADGLVSVTPGLNISVDNREGGQGAVGYSYLLGKTGSPQYLLATETSLLSLPASVEVAFSHRSFTPIFKVGEDFTLLVARPDSPISSCADAVEQGPDALVFSQIRATTGADLDTVPYEGGGESMAAVLGGQVELASLNPSEVIGQLRAGELKALCVFADQRYTYPELAGIPTSVEQGVNVVFAQFRGVIAPGELNPRAREFWVQAARRFAGSPAYREYVASEFLQARPAFGEEFGAYLAGAQGPVEQVVSR
jgi:putative tricarboxylic transport membrane protein